MLLFAVSEAAVQEELRVLQAKAVLLYNQEDFEGAEEKFGEVLEALQVLHPANHPEVLKAEKSLQMVRKRLESTSNNR